MQQFPTLDTLETKYAKVETITPIFRSGFSRRVRVEVTTATGETFTTTATPHRNGEFLGNVGEWVS